MACYLCKRNENLSIDEIAFGLLWFYVYRDFGKWGRENWWERMVSYLTEMRIFSSMRER